MRLAIYVKDDQGLLTRNISDKRFKSIASFIEQYGLSGTKKQKETLYGWPESSVTWLGKVGYARIK